MAWNKCWKYGKSYDYKQSLARHTKLKHSEEDNASDADTDDDDDDNDSKDIKKEKNTNLSTRYDVLDISLTINADNDLLTRRVWSSTSYIKNILNSNSMSACAVYRYFKHRMLLIIIFIRYMQLQRNTQHSVQAE